MYQMACLFLTKVLRLITAWFRIFSRTVEAILVF